MATDHCPPEWDGDTKMCWRPTPAGETATLPCPDDGFLNPKKLASRICLPESAWFINYTFDADKPYTNFHDCLLPDDPSAEEDLKKLIDTRIIFVLKTLDEYKQVHVAVYAISIVLLIAAVLASIAGVAKLNQTKYSAITYLALAIASAALLIHNITTLSLNGVGDATKMFKCRFGKFISLTSTLVFHESILVYIFMCIASVLHIPLRFMFLKLIVATTVIITVLLVITELLLETYSCPTATHCGYKTLQSVFHWLTTTPRILLLMLSLCLASVSVFGTFCLKQPGIDKIGELRHIRQRTLSALLLAVYNFTQEVLFVLIHAEAYMDYSDLPVEEYVSAFSIVTAAQGIVFSVLMCVFDLGVLRMLGLSIARSPTHNTSNECELIAVQTHSARPLQVQKNNGAINNHD